MPNFIDPATGQTFDIPESDVTAAIASGFKPERPEQFAERIAGAQIEKEHSTVSDKIAVGISGLMRGATFGLSDILAPEESQDYLRIARKVNPITAGISEVTGAIAPALLSGGTSAAASAARFLPAGAAARVGARAATAIGEKTAIRTALGAGAAGAIEAVPQAVGNYIADQAIADRDITAEGLVGSGTKGLLFGGGAGASAGLAVRGFTSLRKMFPKGEITKEAVEKAEREGVKAVTSALSDGDALETAARQKLRQNRTARVSADPEAAAHAAAVRAEKLAQEQAKTKGVEALAKRRGVEAEIAGVRLERVKAGKAPTVSKAERQAMLEPEAPPAAAPEAVEDIEQAIDNAVADATPETQVLKAATEELSDAKKRVRDVMAQWEQSAKDIEARRASEVLKGEKLSPELAEAVEAGRLSHRLALDVQTGKLSREEARLRDVVYHPAGEVRPYPGQELKSHLFQKWRWRTSELREPLSEEEIATRMMRPSFEVESPGGFQGRPEGYERVSTDLVDRILAGEKKLSDITVVERTREGGKWVKNRRPATVEDIAGGYAARRPDVDEIVINALRNRLSLDDLAEGIPAIQRLEAAEANLVRVMGSENVPEGSIKRAQEWDAAKAARDDEDVLANTQRTQALEDGAAGEVTAQMSKIADADAEVARAAASGSPEAVTAAQSKRGGLAEAAGVLDLLMELNVPGMPNIRSIPVIGPVLSMYLRGRALFGAFKRVGGKIPSSVESKISGISTRTRNRLQSAVSGLLDAGMSAGKRTRVALPPAAEILSERLFADEGEARRKSGKEGLGEIWAKRADELQRAQEPGAIERSLRDRVQTSDPMLAASLVEVTRRKLSYLWEQMPKPPLDWGIGRKTESWRPSAADTERFARIVHTVDDPIGVLERAQAGLVSIDEVKALRDVYPRLYSEAQKQMLQAAMERTDIPYPRRIQMGFLFSVPLDPTQVPDFMAKQQAGFSKPMAPPPPPPQLPPAPAPGISASVNLSAPMTLQEQR